MTLEDPIEPRALGMARAIDGRRFAGGPRSGRSRPQGDIAATVALRVGRRGQPCPLAARAPWRPDCRGPSRVRGCLRFATHSRSPPGGRAGVPASWPESPTGSWESLELGIRGPGESTASTGHARPRGARMEGARSKTASRAPRGSDGSPRGEPRRLPGARMARAAPSVWPMNYRCHRQLPLRSLRESLAMPGADETGPGWHSLASESQRVTGRSRSRSAEASLPPPPANLGSGSGAIGRQARADA